MYLTVASALKVPITTIQSCPQMRVYQGRQEDEADLKSTAESHIRALHMVLPVMAKQIIAGPSAAVAVGQLEQTQYHQDLNPALARQQNWDQMKCPESTILHRR